MEMFSTGGGSERLAGSPNAKGPDAARAFLIFSLPEN